MAKIPISGLRFSNNLKNIERKVGLGLLMAHCTAFFKHQMIHITAIGKWKVATCVRLLTKAFTEQKWPLTQFLRLQLVPYDSEKPFLRNDTPGQANVHATARANEACESVLFSLLHWKRSSCLFHHPHEDSGSNNNGEFAVFREA